MKIFIEIHKSFQHIENFFAKMMNLFNIYKSFPAKFRFQKFDLETEIILINFVLVE